MRVVELARILAGPLIGQTLADLGADVIKVESPEGDDTRKWVRRSSKPGKSARRPIFMVAIAEALDHRRLFAPARARDRALPRGALGRADREFKVGGLAKFGLDYETLGALNPRLVYCSLTGFGQTGPYAERPGYDFLI